MKLRVMGTDAECAALVGLVADLGAAGVVELVDQSNPFPCRAPSRLVRVYLEVRLPERGGAR